MRIYENTKSAILNLAKTKDKEETHFIVLQNRNKIRWAIVVAWVPGFEEVNFTDDDFSDGEYRICAKVAYQPTNSLMQEYDIDWLMHYDEETGDVDDTETTVGSYDDIDDVINWLICQWERIERSLERWTRYLLAN